MKKHLLKSSVLALLAAVLSIWSIACGSALNPAATLVATAVPAAAPTETPDPPAAPTETAVPPAAPTETAVPPAAPTETPDPPAAPTETPDPPAAPTETPEPPAAPTPTTGPTATSFNPDLVSLAAIGSSATITVETLEVDSEALGVQINVQHPAELQVASPACAGIFSAATELGPSPAAGGTVIGCVLLTGDVSGSAGVVMTFELTRIGNFNTDQVVTFGVGGPLGTTQPESGITNDPGASQLIVRP